MPEFVPDLINDEKTKLDTVASALAANQAATNTKLDTVATNQAATTSEIPGHVTGD